MAALHRIQWIDSEIRAGRCPNARRVAEWFEISHRQAQRDFEYLRDSLGAPLVYAAAERGYRYDGEAFVLPGQFVTPAQRGVLENLADYYERWAERREDVALDDVAALFARLSGREAGYGRTQRAAPGSASPALGLPFLATLALPGTLPLPHMTGLGVPISEGLAPYYRADEGPGRITFEFHDADGFLAALLGAGLPFRVEHPRWLRERVAARAAAMHAANRADEANTGAVTAMAGERRNGAIQRHSRRTRQ
jgi:predicted DNA-binding transcriptional regulator YafY